MSNIAVTFLLGFCNTNVSDFGIGLTGNGYRRRESYTKLLSCQAFQDKGVVMVICLSERFNLNTTLGKSLNCDILNEVNVG